MTIILISEENHGTIGAATSYKEAIKWLIRSEWLNSYDEFEFEDGKFESLESRFGVNWYAVAPTLPDTFYDGLFYFHEVPLHGAE